MASGATEEDSKHERLYRLDKPVKILPEQKHGFYIYGNSASAVCFSCSDRTGGNSDLENEDLVVHTGCAMNAVRFSSQGNDGLYELAGGVEYQLCDPSLMSLSSSLSSSSSSSSSSSGV